MKPGPHRRDIDGLRAIAVLAVMVYHFTPGLLGGGFCGVDIFFVISGFVITKSIIADTIAKKFSITNFYVKRIKRIIPAYAAVAVLSSIAAIIILLPPDLIDFCKSLAAASSFVSNIYFWESSGYFAAAAHTKPLLHTWSLSVEEQFYIFAPILMYLLIKHGGTSKALLLLPLLAMSFAISVLAIFIGPSGGFYLLPARAWELLIGCLVALHSRPMTATRLARELAGATGAILVLGSLVLLNEHDPFPGWNALYPCIGTALLIEVANLPVNDLALPLTNRALCCKPLVWIGLVSYSLYLIHWPVIVFTRYVLLRDVTIPEGVLMVALCIMLAAGCWRFVEQPFRQRSRVPRGSIIAAGGLVMVFLCAMGGAGVALRGMPARFADFYEQTVPGGSEWGDDHCFNTNPVSALDWDAAICTRIHGRHGRILLWGDSFAAQYTPGIIRDAARINADVLQYTFAGCPPILTYRTLDRVGCAPSNQRVPGIIVAQHIDTVVLAARWISLPHHAIAGLPTTIKTLRELGVRVFVVGQSPEFPMDVQRYDYLSGARKMPGEAGWQVYFDPAFNRALAAIVSDAIFIDPMKYLCDGGVCPYRTDRNFYFADNGHFSLAGSIRAVRAYFPVGRADR